MNYEIAVSRFSKSYSKDPFWFSLGLPVGVMHFSQDHPCFIMSGILEKRHRFQEPVEQQHFLSHDQMCDGRGERLKA